MFDYGLVQQGYTLLSLDRNKYGYLILGAAQLYAKIPFKSYPFNRLLSFDEVLIKQFI